MDRGSRVRPAISQASYAPLLTPAVWVSLDNAQAVWLTSLTACRSSGADHARSRCLQRVLPQARATPVLRCPSTPTPARVHTRRDLGFRRHDHRPDDGPAGLPA